jgi:hypothetical protein
MRGAVVGGEESEGRRGWEWVIRRRLWGHNNMPFGQPTPGRNIGCPGSDRPKGVFGV